MRLAFDVFPQGKIKDKKMEIKGEMTETNEPKPNSYQPADLVGESP